MLRTLAYAGALVASTSALSIPANANAVARPAAPELSWAAGIVNRDIELDLLPAPEDAPELPRMELLDMQTLDLELHDMEHELLESWRRSLADSFGLETEDELTAEALSDSAFVR